MRAFVKKIRITIFVRIMLTSLFIVSLPIAGLWYFNTYIYQVEVKKNVSSKFEQQSNLLASKINGWFDINTRLLKQSTELVAVSLGGAERERREILKSVVNNYDWIISAFTIDKAGYIDTLSDNTPINREYKSDTFFRGDTDIFRSLRGGRTYSYTVSYSQSRLQNIITLCRAKYISAVGGFDGAVCIIASLSDISSAIKGMGLNQSAKIFLLSESGDLMLSSSIVNTVFDSIRETDFMSSEFDGLIYEFSDAQGTSSVGYKNRMDLMLQLIFVEDFESAYAGVISARNQAGAFILATILFSMLLAYLVSKKLSKPIRNLTNAAESISMGKFSVEVAEVIRSDEIGELAQAVQRMGVSLEMMLTRMKSARENSKSA